jgi:hypothetical protein
MRYPLHELRDWVKRGIMPETPTKAGYGLIGGDPVTIARFVEMIDRWQELHPEVEDE